MVQNQYDMKTIVLVAIALLGCTQLSSAQRLNKHKKEVIASVEKHESALIAISDSIWALAETAFEEHQSSRILADYAEQQGFSV